MRRVDEEHARRVAGMVAESVQNMSDDERLVFFDAVKRGYCEGCGRKMAQQDVCHCRNDE